MGVLLSFPVSGSLFLILERLAPLWYVPLSIVNIRLGYIPIIIYLFNFSKQLLYIVLPQKSVASILSLSCYEKFISIMSSSPRSTHIVRDRKIDRYIDEQTNAQTGE